MVDDSDLHQPGADVETDCLLLATEECHGIGAEEEARAVNHRLPTLRRGRKVVHGLNVRARCCKLTNVFVPNDLRLTAHPSAFRCSPDHQGHADRAGRSVLPGTRPTDPSVTSRLS